MFAFIMHAHKKFDSLSKMKYTSSFGRYLVLMRFGCLQVESETASSEFKLNNATQRLQGLEKHVALLKEKASNTTSTAEKADKDMEDINKVAEKLKKVSLQTVTYILYNIQTGL